MGQLPHGQDKTHGNNNMLSMGQYVSKETLDKYFREESSNLPSAEAVPTPVAIPLRAGQMTLHSFYSVHYSGPNRSTSSRVGFALRYIDGDVVTQSKSVAREMVTPIFTIS